jgi:dUTP pyrophosphatase
MAININFTRLHSNAVQPSQGSQWAAGYDLYSCGSYIIEPHTTLKIGTGIAVEIPEGYFGAIFARSGLATKRGLRPANCVGVVDADYRGELIVALHNDTDFAQDVAEGERIAQLAIIPHLSVRFVEVDDLTSTERGEGGFGSTGTH